MHIQTLLACWGGLVHDLGKVVFRAGGSQSDHSRSGAAWLQGLPPAWAKDPALLDCVRFHHSRALRTARLPQDSPAYLVYLADNLAAAADRRSRETQEPGRFDRALPLSPVFTHMNGCHPGMGVPLRPLDSVLRMPLPAGQVSVQPEGYQALLHGLEQNLSALPEMGWDWLNSLLVVLESWTSGVPSSTFSGESPDISLYDHLKITGAVAGCISEYLLAKGETDYRKTLLTQEQAFRSEPVFLLYSADFSGIQKFIYTVSTSNALRSLRSRSFFLELAMEHYIDELLSLCGLDRANLLYSGGGHCYLLLPNTPSVQEAVAHWNTQFNDWLLSEFGAALYLADGWTVCTANDLTNTPSEQAPYQKMFQRVSQAIQTKKLHRYSAAQLRALNRPQRREDGRECRVCGRSDTLVSSRDGEGLLCPWCRRFEDLSEQIMRRPVLSIHTQPVSEGIPLPSPAGPVYWCFSDEATVRRALADGAGIHRVYTINQACSGLRYSTRLFVGNYAANNRMDQLAAQSQGIRRLGICRMDVDDLGMAFVAGFEQADQFSTSDKMHYVTLSRTAAFSRQMSLFFKLYINSILDGSYGKQPKLQVAVVYSGGDDVFLVGAWNETIEAAQRIRTAFRAYTCGSLTISCGIGVFPDHYPIRLAANQTAELEASSKGLPKKDGITLFDPSGAYTYPWDQWENAILREKLPLLQRFFQDKEQRERGNSFLYRLVALLRDSDASGSKLPLARYAYLLARLEPPKGNSNERLYGDFSRKMYDWALDPKARGELELATLLYVYQTRGEESEDA